MLASRLLKSVTGLCPKSAHRMGQRPPFDFFRRWSSSWNVPLLRLIMSLALYIQASSMRVFLSEV